MSLRSGRFPRRAWTFRKPNKRAVPGVPPWHCAFCIRKEAVHRLEAKGGFHADELDLDGNVLEGTHKPSSEIKMHLRVFKENPKVQGVVHAHPLTATAFACAGISLEEPVLMEGVLSLGCVPLVHFALPGTEEVPEAVAPYCREYNAVLLANHGALTWGDNLMQAYYRMETTEYYAKILMINNFILGKKTLLSQGQIDDIIKIRAGWGITTGGRPIGPEGAQNLEDICISRNR